MWYSAERPETRGRPVKLTAKEFTKKPAEAFRLAEKGETIVINHDRYPTVVFELTARARCCELNDKEEEDDD